jgi:hypothetical protein
MQPKLPNGREKGQKAQKEYLAEPLSITPLAHLRG